MTDKVVSKGKDTATHDCSATASTRRLCHCDGSPPPGASLCWLGAKTRCVFLSVCIESVKSRERRRSKGRARQEVWDGYLCALGVLHVWLFGCFVFHNSCGHKRGSSVLCGDCIHWEITQKGEGNELFTNRQVKGEKLTQSSVSEVNSVLESVHTMYTINFMKSVL